MRLLLMTVLVLLLSACGPSQSEIDANVRAAQAEQRAADANRRADEYWWQAKWANATQPEKIGVMIAGICAIALFGLLATVVNANLSDAAGRRAHELDMREMRLREQQAANERAALMLAAQQLQIRQQEAQAQLPYDKRLKRLEAKYGPVPQLPPKS